MALQYCITRGAPGAGSVGAVPGSMGRFAFAPVETQHGSFRMAVDYAPSSAVTILKDSTSHGPTAQVPILNILRLCISLDGSSNLRAAHVFTA